MLDYFLGHFIYLVMISLRSTYRFRYTGLENFEEAKKISKNQGLIFGFWHQNLIHSILAQRGKYHQISGMGSHSRDANALAIATAKLGIHVVRGSSAKNGVNKGGKAARDQMLEHMKNGIIGTLTIDGPKGPAKEVKPGVIDIAKKSGCAIIPYLVIPKSYWAFKSWDRFRLPKPFSKIIVHYGRPIVVSKDLEGEEFSKVCGNLKNTLLCDEKLIDGYFEKFAELSKSNFCPKGTNN